MAQFSVKIIRLNGAVLDENQHRADPHPHAANLKRRLPTTGVGTTVNLDRPVHQHMRFVVEFGHTVRSAALHSMVGVLQCQPKFRRSPVIDFRTWPSLRRYIVERAFCFFIRPP